MINTIIKYLLLIGVLFVVQSCKNDPSSHPNSSLRETGEEVYKEALTIAVDTTAAAFAQLVVLDNNYKKGVQSHTLSYYIQNGMKTRWLYQDMPSRLFAEYLAVLDSIDSDGLNPETYRRTALKNTVDSLYAHQVPDEVKAECDKEITASFFLLLEHLTKGRFAKKFYGEHSWFRPKNTLSPSDLLLQIDDKEPLSGLITSLLPTSKQYQKMRVKYAALKKLTADSLLVLTIDNPKNFAVGYTATVVTQLRNILKQKGFDSSITDTPETVDSTLIAAVQRFQQSKGLTPDGVLGKQTLYFINMNPTKERDLLQLNMERMRVFNNNLGDNYAIVNIPDFKLALYQKDSVLFETKVVVGKSATSTPIFTDTIQYVEFRPTWSVPQSIIKKEIIPQIVSQANPEKYKNRGYTMYENGKKIDPTQVDWNDPSVRKRRFFFVEAPSANNSLGLVKFILTNSMSIYLHDTPSKYFFDREVRALSHGCVRVQNPSQLAYQLLKNEDAENPWTEERVNEAMHGKRNQYRVPLKTKFKINIIYNTSWIDEQGQQIIKNDIYNIDDEQLKEIKQFDS